METLKAPFNLRQWIDENRDLLKPPVGNKNIYKHESDDFIVMVVGGPNARKDYHYNETDEFFYQLEGDIQIALQVDGKKHIVELHEGDVFLIPAGTPHSPMRSAGSVGLVVEIKNKPGKKDGLLWFCDQCNHKLHEVYFTLHDIEKDFLNHFRDFYHSEELRTCSSCGTIMPTDERFVK